jgi:hypothetical protein
MYKRDVAIIAEHAAKSPEGLVDVVEFVLCTIQAGLSTVKTQRRDIAETGLSSRFLWGKKADGLAYIQQNADWLWLKLHHLKDKGPSNPDVIAEATLLLMQVPNLGMVKASFVLQCMGFNTACIDSHNLKRLGLKPSAVKISDKLSTEKKRAKVIAYVELCQKPADLQITGAEWWWDTWCNHVAGNQANRRLDTGDAVSAFHVDCVIL